MKVAARFSLLAMLIGVSGCGYTPPPTPHSQFAFIFPPTHDLVTVDKKSSVADMSPEALAKLSPAAGGGSSTNTANITADLPPEALAQLSPAAGGSGTAKATPIVLHDNAPGATQLRLQDNEKAIGANTYHPLGLMRTIPSDY